MISLTSANVSLKPSQKKQLMTRLKRAVRLGERLGNFLLNIKIKGCGKHMEVTATGRDRSGDFSYRARQLTLADCMRMIVRTILQRLHGNLIMTPA